MSVQDHVTYKAALTDDIFDFSLKLATFENEVINQKFSRTGSKSIFSQWHHLQNPPHSEPIRNSVKLNRQQKKVIASNVQKSEQTEV